MADLVLFKIVLTIVLLILGLASVVAPKYCCKNKPYWFSVGNMFSAGVLLSAAVVHSLSDANSTIFYESSKIPYANMICGFSFLVMLLIEEVGHSAHDAMETKHSRSAEAGTESQENHHNTDECKENHNGHAHLSFEGNNYRSIEYRYYRMDTLHGDHHHQALGRTPEKLNEIYSDVAFCLSNSLSCSGFVDWCVGSIFRVFRAKYSSS